MVAPNAAAIIPVENQVRADRLSAALGRFSGVKVCDVSEHIFQSCDCAYTESLERAGRTDAIIAIAGPRRTRGTHPT